MEASIESSNAEVCGSEKEFMNHFSKLRALSTSQYDVLRAAASLITHCYVLHIAVNLVKLTMSSLYDSSSDYVTTNVNIHILALSYVL